MKFPFVPIDDLIDQVKTELRSFNQQGQVSSDDCYMYGLDIARELNIGEDGLDNTTTFLTIRNRQGMLPKDFYVTKEIWLCKASELTYSTRTIGTTEELIDYKPTILLRPGDSQTLKYCAKDYYNPEVSGTDHSYVLRVPPGTIRTSFQHGVIQLTYYRIPISQEGIIMIPDEINCKKAVVSYIKMKLIQERYISGDIARYIYQDIKQEYEESLTTARQIIKFDNPSDAEYQAASQSKRYSRFKL